MVTKEQFLKVYYPSNKLSNFMKYFYVGIGEIIYITILAISLFIFFLTYSGHYNNWSIITKLSFFIFNSIFPVSVMSYIATIINNKRIKNICKLLNIEIKQFSSYEDMYIKKASK